MVPEAIYQVICLKFMIKCIEQYLNLDTNNQYNKQNYKNSLNRSEQIIATRELARGKTS